MTKINVSAMLVVLLTFVSSVATASEKVPAYVIEPPDVLMIDSLRLAPKPDAADAALQSHDVVRVSVQSMKATRQSENREAISPAVASLEIDDAGSVDLGPLLGKVNVAQSTPGEAAKIVAERLRQLGAQSKVSVTLERSAIARTVNGEHLVSPDGTVNLGDCGIVRVSGMTIEKAKAAVERQLRKYFADPSVSIDVYAYNSKVYYIITQGDDPQDSLMRVPITGNETVLDALAQLKDAKRLASKHIWIARPGPGGKGIDKVLPVNWEEITTGSNAAANFQVRAGDRVFISSTEEIPSSDAETNSDEAGSNSY